VAVFLFLINSRAGSSCACLAVTEGAGDGSHHRGNQDHHLEAAVGALSVTLTEDEAHTWKSRMRRIPSVNYRATAERRRKFLGTRVRGAANLAARERYRYQQVFRKARENFA
jgi:hypothetical protein